MVGVKNKNIVIFSVKQTLSSFGETRRINEKEENGNLGLSMWM